MKTRRFSSVRLTAPVLLMALILSLSLVITSTSCKVGTDGRPGLAYIAFEWEESKPDYIDCGTSAVPPNFYYGTYYRISPGWYTAYYEGKVWTGQAYGSYAWEMDYEIWVNEGQRGGYGFNGRDGLNTYLDFVCSPYGPRLYRHDSHLRKAPEAEHTRDADSPGFAPGIEYVEEYEVGDYMVRITARSVEPRSGKGSGNHPLN